MAKTTLLRVKRRRDEAPPPSTFRVAIGTNVNENSNASSSSSSTTTTKRARHAINRYTNNVNQLANLMHKTSFVPTNSVATSVTSAAEQQTQPIQHQRKRRAAIFQKMTHFPTARGHGSKRKMASSSSPLPSSPLNENATQNQYEGEGDLHLNIIDATFAFEQQSGSSSSISCPDENVNASANANATESTQKIQSQEHHQQQQPPTKRKKVSLQMVDSRTMTESEFWKNYVETSSTSTSLPPTAVKNAKPASAAASTASTSSATSISKLNKKKKNVVLDPITQMINKSLSSLHPSTTSQKYNDPTQAIMSHINIVQTHGLSKLRKYINWKSISQPPKTSGSPSSMTSPASTSTSTSTISNGSTILHMTALLNSTEAAQYICTNYSGIIDFFLVDDDGYTARDVAELIGSDGVAQVISLYMVGECNNRSTKQCWGDRIIGGESGDFSGGGGHSEGIDSGSSVRDSTEGEREEDYVYDVYCLKGDDEGDEDESRIDSESGSKKLDGINGSSDSMLSSGSLDVDQNRQREEFTFGDTDSSDPIPILGGVGYWNEKGELVLETSPTDEGHHSDIEEEEYDSNCEEYIGNDYPEDDDDDFETNSNEYYNNYNNQNGFSRGLNEEYDSDDDVYDMPGSSQFRNHAIDISVGSNSGHPSVYQYGGFDDDEGDAEYSGLMYANGSQWGDERINGKTEAYDPMLDDDSE